MQTSQLIWAREVRP